MAKLLLLPVAVSALATLSIWIVPAVIFYGLAKGSAGADYHIDALGGERG